MVLRLLAPLMRSCGKLKKVSIVVKFSSVLSIA